MAAADTTNKRAPGEPAMLQGLRITFAQVRSFVTLASTCNFTRTADALNLSQPALTSRIRQLEEALDLQLFHRTARTVTLTEAGEELLPAFLTLVNNLESAVVNAQDHAANANRTIRLACLPSCANTVLPEPIRRFKERHPDAAFVVEDVLNGRVRDLVRQGKVDFGVCAEADDDPELVATPLYVDELVAVYLSGHPLDALDKVRLPDLGQYPLILTSRPSSIRAQVEQAFAVHGLVLAPAYSVNYVSSATALARAGLGVAILPSTMTDPLPADARARRVEDPAFTRRMVVVRRRDVPLRRLAKVFLELIAPDQSEAGAA